LIELDFLKSKAEIFSIAELWSKFLTELFGKYSQ
jgi:hypothetical protein